MRNEVAEECGCYRLIQLLVIIQQLVSVYLVGNYPLKGSTGAVKTFVWISTLIFSSIGVIGSIGAHTYDDSLLTVFMIALIAYAVIQTVICHRLVRTEATISDYHCVLWIVSVLLASLTFTTLTTRHTFSEYRHSDHVWSWMSSHDDH